MNERLIKPRVFLSHSKLDADFVRHLCEDLRKCQIDPWIDEIEIRPGKPWLDVIFEDGIPTCDSVFVYLTDKSVQSAMVKKEIDAGIIQQLTDRHVSFLPYINEEELRIELRPDIRALQVPVWNPVNYSDVLPRFVAEVWRSFTERRLHAVVQEEQNRRLKAEIELEKLSNDRQSSVFSAAENEDFKYVWKSMDYFVSVVVTEIVQASKTESRVTRDFRLTLNIGTLFAELPAVNGAEYVNSSLNSYVAVQAGKLINGVSELQGAKKRYHINKPIEIRDQLLMYGLLQSHYVPHKQMEDTKWQLMLRDSSHKYVYSERMHRLRYWLAYNQLLPSSLKFGETIEALEQNKVDS